MFRRVHHGHGHGQHGHGQHGHRPGHGNGHHGHRPGHGNGHHGHGQHGHRNGHHGRGQHGHRNGHHGQGQGQGHHEQTFKIFCRANEGYYLTVRHDAVVLARADPRDGYQHWVKDMRHNIIIMDKEGHRAFALVNRATGKALHSLGENQPVRLVPYNPDNLDESVLWTESRDVGHGFRCIRRVNNIYLNFHFHVDQHRQIVLWNRRRSTSDNKQHWKIVPSPGLSTS